MKKLCLPMRRAYSRIALQKIAVALDSMCYRVHAQAVDIGDGNPVLVGFDQRVEHILTADVELFQAQKIAVDRLLGIVPVDDLTAPFVTLGTLQLDRPHRAVGRRVRRRAAFAPEAEIKGTAGLSGIEIREVARIGPVVAGVI